MKQITNVAIIAVIAGFLGGLASSRLFSPPSVSAAGHTFDTVTTKHLIVLGDQGNESSPQNKPAVIIHSNGGFYTPALLIQEDPSHKDNLGAVIRAGDQLVRLQSTEGYQANFMATDQPGVMMTLGKDQSTWDVQIQKDLFLVRDPQKAPDGSMLDNTASLGPPLRSGLRLSNDTYVNAKANFTEQLNFDGLFLSYSQTGGPSRAYLVDSTGQAAHH